MDPFAIVHDAGALTLFGLWLGSALWVYTDARGRFERVDRARKLFVAALTLPFATPLLYGCLRPSELVSERRARELSRRLLEEDLVPGERCLVCRMPIEPDFLRCPGCASELRRRCPDCAATLRAHWSACPHCERELHETDRGLRLVA